MTKQNTIFGRQDNYDEVPNLENLPVLKKMAKAASYNENKEKMTQPQNKILDEKKLILPKKMNK